MSSTQFSAFEPQPDELLLRIGRHIDDGMLEEIAAADYGNRLQEHLQHLRRIRTDCAFAVPMRWEPREVLELIRWSEPEDPQWRPGGHGRRGHWMRAFACTALLRAGGEFENSELRSGWNQTLIQLVGSLCALGAEFNKPACSLLAWLILRFETSQEDEELCFLAVGLLSFALSAQGSLIPDDAIISLSDWIIDRERLAPHLGPHRKAWLLGTTFFDLRHDMWRNLGRALAAFSDTSRSRDAIERVRSIGTLLVQTGS